MRSKFQFVNEIPKTYLGRYINYNGQEIYDLKARYCSLHNTILINQDRWLLEYDDWYKGIYKKLLTKSDFFSFSIISRSTIWYPLNLDSLFFTLALLKFSENINEEILVINAPGIVKKYLETEKNISLQSLIYKFYFKFKCLLLFLLRALNLFFKILFNYKITKPQINTKQIVFSYNLQSKKDHFFGTIFDDKLDEFTYIYHFDKYNFNNDIYNNQTITIFDYLYIKDLFFCFFNQCKLFFQILNQEINLSLNFSNIKINGKYFTRHFFNNTLYLNPPLIEFVVYRCFYNIIKNNNIDKIVYPYEEKGSEHALLLALKVSNKNVKTISFAHANYNIGHRYIFFDTDIKLYPDYLATTGIIQKNWLSNFCNWPNEKLFVFGSPRYSFNFSNIKEPNRKSIIFLVGYLHELNQFYNFLKSDIKIFKNFNLHIRLYPHSHLLEQMNIVDSIRKIGVNVFVDTKISLSENLKKIDFVLFSSSSAGIESIINNCYAIYFPMNLNIITNSLENKENSNTIPAITTKIELVNLLKALTNLTNDELIKKKKEQVTYINNFYSKISFKYFNQIS